MKEMKVLIITLELIAAAFGVCGLIWGANEYIPSSAPTVSSIKAKKSQIVKYYNEYKDSDDESERDVILDIVRSEFSDFDENKIQIDVIKEFLVEARGY
jgi:hypothetical protein